MSRPPSITARLHAIFHTVELAYALGALGALVELTVSDRLAAYPSDYVLVLRLGIAGAFYAAGLWALFGLGLSIVSWGRGVLVSLWLALVLQQSLLFLSPLGHDVSTRTWLLSFAALSPVAFLMVYVARRKIERLPEKRRRIERILRWGRHGICGTLLILWGMHVLQYSDWHVDFSRPTPPPSAPNLLIMVVDSLRADHVSLYGYRKKTTPVIDRHFKEGGIAFRECQASGTWTRPTVATLVTGRFFPAGELHGPLYGRLSPGSNTLFERYHRVGYSTAWFTANHWASPMTGMAPLADHLVMTQRTHISFPIALSDRLLNALNWSPLQQRIKRGLTQWAHVADGDWLDPAWLRDDQLASAFLKWHQGEQGRPWIAYIHFMQVHAPYGDAHGRGLQPDLSLDTLPPSQDTGARRSKRIQAHIDGYDADLLFTDAQIGRIVTELKRRGQWEHTTVMITADHGEEFGEHGAFGHLKTFHRGVTHVPLILSGPGLIGPRWVETPVHQIDWLPTLLALSGLPADPTLPGQNLMGLASGRKPIWKESTRTLPMYYTRDQGTTTLGVRQGVYQLYLWTMQGQRFTVLHNLHTDPEERFNLAPFHPEIVHFFQQEAHRWGMREPENRR